jgi:hypothetical protein
MNIPSFYVNIKNNTVYFAEKIIKSATNGQEGIKKVLYFPYIDNEVKWDNGYERELSEFKTKFKEGRI